MTLLLVLAASEHAIAEQPAAGEEMERVSLGTFEKDLEKWTYNGGWEFKGARGKLQRDDTVAAEGSASAKLSGDFTGGGAYVAMVRDFRINAREFHFRIKAPGLKSLDLRVTDNSKQIFQHRVALQETDQWQEVSLTDLAKGKHYGGANDGVWHFPARSLWIMLPNTVADKKGAIWVDQIEAVAPKQVIRPPASMPETVVPPPADSIFGFSAHMVHTDLFYDFYNVYNHLEYTLPFVSKGGFGIMRETIYPRCQLKPEIIEQYLKMYQDAGIRVILCPLTDRPTSANFTSYWQWVAGLAAKFPCIAAVEIHNEPNLKHFWRGTAEEYAEVCKQASAIIKAQSPHTPILIGSVSHLWWGPGVDWLKAAIEHGALDGADGLSVHPYRQQSPPEGGSMHAAADDPDGFAKEVDEWWAMIQHYNTTGKPLTLYFTEVGYSTGRGSASLMTATEIGGGLARQADYIARLALIVFDMRMRGIPVMALNWYDLKCDREDDGLESNFGVISYDTGSVRPAYTAYSRIAKTFEKTADFSPVLLSRTFGTNPQFVKSFAWRRFSDGAVVVAFWRLDQLQPDSADFESDLRLEPPAGFESASMELTELAADTTQPLAFTQSPDGVTTHVRVTSRPQWIVLKPKSPSVIATRDLCVSTLPAVFTVGDHNNARIEIKADQQAITGQPLKMEILVDNSAADVPLAGEINVMGRSVPFSAAAGAQEHLAVDAGQALADKAQSVYYYIQVGSTVVGRGGYVVSVRDPLEMALLPVLDGHGELVLHLRNNFSTRASEGGALRITGVKWTAGDKSGSSAVNITLNDGQTGEVRVPCFAATAYEDYSFSIEVSAADRAAFKWAGKAGDNPCRKITPVIDGQLNEWEGTQAIDLSQARVVMKNYQGPEDLSGQVWIGYDADYFYFAARVQDNVFHQRTIGSKMFNDDGFQIAWSSITGTPEGGWHELGLALTPEGPKVWRWLAPKAESYEPGVVFDVKMAAHNEGQTTIYECAIPWSQLRPITPADGAFRFSVLVNDNDGKNRRGWIEWGSGIGKSKNAKLFRTCRFEQR